jgi:chemotaxis protein MotB
MSKKRHAHHGGAWKVAYADFVTAMMALFLVLWLASQDQKIKEAVQRSFRNPFATLTKESTGIIPQKDTVPAQGSEGSFDSASAVELNMLRKMAEDLMKAMQSDPDAASDNPMKVEVTPEGMRISVFDRNHKPIFEPDSAKFTPYGSWIFSTLAWELARYKNIMVELDGHTEAGYAPKTPDYTEWELSADRANAARRKLIEHDVAPAQIREVAGFGDTHPLPGVDPADETNRRVGVLVKVKSGGNI